MIEAVCHCGSIKIEMPAKPDAVTDCNCSICRRYGTLWAYYPAADVRIHARPEALSTYSWGDRRLNFFRCKDCGCITHWMAVENPLAGKMGVNIRNVDPEQMKGVRIRHLDGALSWKFLD